MQRRVKNFLEKRPFLSHVVTLGTGTAMGQIFATLAAPLLTRIYAPEHFAAVALFSSCVNVLYVIACGRYELVLMVLKDEEDAVNLLYFCVLLSTAFSLFLFLITWLFAPFLLKLFGNIKNLSDWIWYLPPAVLFFILGTIGLRWQSRKERFKLISQSQASFAIIAPSTQLLISLLLGSVSGSMLIWGRLLGKIVSIFVLLKSACSELYSSRTNLSIKKASKIALQYWRFPIYLGPSGVISFLSAEAPSFLLAGYFAPETLGFYALGCRVLATPATFLGQAVGEVFFQRIAKTSGNHSLSRALLLKVLRNLFVAAIGPALILILWGDVIFSFVFGSEWETAGRYAQILAPMLAAQFVVWPTRMLLQAMQTQLVAFIWFIVQLGLTVASFYYGKKKNSAEAALLYYSVCSTIMYCIYALLSIYCIRNSSLPAAES